VPGEDEDGPPWEINTNEGKAKILAQIFFPEKPERSRVPENYNYPEPLPPLPPITPEQIEHQIRRLSPFKASGPDKILNVVLQKCLEHLLEYLLHLFRGVFDLRTYYVGWQDPLTTAVLKKPDKPNYELPKAWHLITLLCTIPKVLTALVAESIRHLVEKNTLLPDTHFGG
ncbi:hypothetical protein K443DRAFT_43798, partial [Laccaria amethystina LaAM-08-1]